MAARLTNLRALVQAHVKTFVCEVREDQRDGDRVHRHAEEGTALSRARVENAPVCRVQGEPRHGSG